jgi:hypothetical protein
MSPSYRSFAEAVAMSSGRHARFCGGSDLYPLARAALSGHDNPDTGLSATPPSLFDADQQRTNEIIEV